MEAKHKTLEWNSPDSKPKELQLIFVAWKYSSHHGIGINHRIYREFHKDGKTKTKYPFGIQHGKTVIGWLPIPD